MHRSSLTIKVKKQSDQHKRLARNWKSLLEKMETLLWVQLGPVVEAQLSLCEILHCQKPQRRKGQYFSTHFRWTQIYDL
jgi:hypothetical protein